MAKHNSQRISLLLNQEIAGVVTAMRQNAKWAMVPTRYTRMQDDEMGDDPLLEDFKVLRRRIFHWHDWSVVDPLEYLGPFLEVIRSPETSGPITGTALTSLTRFLDQFVIGESSSHVAAVMRTTADAVTQCKFESTDPPSDDTVLFKILQVLLACVRCPGGKYLTDDNVINIFQACFKIGHYAGDPQKDHSGRHADLLTAASRQVMIELVSIIFRQMGDMPTTPHSAGHSRSPRNLLTEAMSPRSSNSELPAQHASADGHSDAIGNGHADPMASGSETTAQAQPPLERTTSLNTTGRSDSAIAAGSGLAGITIPKSKTEKGGHESGHGLDSIVEVLGFIIGLINSNADGNHADLNVFGLELMNIALNSGTSEFAKHEDLMLLFREDLWQALFQAVRTGQLGALAGAGQVALSLWLHLGSQLLLQLEAFLQIILLRLAQGYRNTASQHQEAALEVLLDFCNQTGFIRAVYANLDCRVERSNLFESICALLSKTAFPVNSPLGSVHLHSLEGLFSILNALSKGCTGLSTWDGLDDGVSPKETVAVWAACCEGAAPPLLSRRHRDTEAPDGDLDSPHARAKAKADEERRSMVETAILEKLLKNRLAVAAEHFNRDYKKGFQYLQSIHLLDEKPKATQVARFLRFCPSLSKQTIGELLGEHDDFFLEVLDEFTKTFEFKGLSFDRAMRLFLESFRLPGEAQKINRIMESFGSHYHEQCPHLFKNADSVYILAYSVILLNTDQHNSQVKKKMTCDEFIRNNRGINAGENLPQDFLRGLYDSISRNEIRISSEASASASPVLWTQLAQASVAPRGTTLDLANLGTPKLDRQMFGLMCGPTVAAVSVVLDHAEDPVIVRHALDGLLLAAKIAAFHHVDEVMDSLVVSLSKFTAALDPAAPKPALAFGENEKARIATQALFTLANRYGDSLRSGWKNLLACVMRLFQLNLLPPAVLLLESEDTAAAKERLPRPSASRRTPASASLLSRAFSSLISIDSGESTSAEARPREAAASQNTAACIEACRLDELFADSKFLRAESLIELVKAIMWAAGPVNRIAASGEESDTAEVGVELVIVVALRNRDRLLLIWPLVHDMLSTILAPEAARTANPLVKRAALGLLRICRRLLHYKADSADALLKSMHMVLRLDSAVAWDLAPAIAAEVLVLVKSCGEAIRAGHGWRTVCLLISITGLSPEACGTALEALHAVVQEPVLSPLAFLPCLETASTFIDNQNKAVQPEAGLRALQSLEDMFDWLLSYCQKLRAAQDAGQGQTGAEGCAPLPSIDDMPSLNLGTPVSPTSPSAKVPDVPTMWLALLRLLNKVSAEQHPRLCEQALQLQNRVVMGSDSLGLSPKLWLEVLQSELVPVTAHFAHRLASAKRDARVHGPPLRSSLKLLSKALLHYLPALAEQPGFPEMWAGLLHLFQDCTRTKSEELTEVVPEALKNILLVMAAHGVLTPAWQDAEGHSLWELTWLRAQAVSSGLTPALLATSGLVTPPPAQEQPPAEQPQAFPLQSSDMPSSNPQPAAVEQSTASESITLPNPAEPAEGSSPAAAESIEQASMQGKKAEVAQMPVDMNGHSSSSLGLGGAESQQGASELTSEPAAAHLEADPFAENSASTSRAHDVALESTPDSTMHEATSNAPNASHPLSAETQQTPGSTESGKKEPSTEQPQSSMEGRVHEQPEDAEKAQEAQVPGCKQS